MKPRSRIAEALRLKRREMGLTQSDLARQAECTQSAISMFEAGRADALSLKTVKRIAEILEIDLDAIRDEPATEAAGTAVLKYCPVDECYSNIPYVVHDTLCLYPGTVRAPRAERTRCRWCGEPMESACPNRECGADIVAGAFCPLCGEPYITATGKEEPVTDWADAQRRRIREIQDALEHGLND